MKKTKFVAIFFLLLLSTFTIELSAKEYYGKHHTHSTKKVYKYKKYKSNSSSTFFGLNLNLNPLPNLIEQNYISTPAYVAAPAYQPVMVYPQPAAVVQQQTYYSTYQQPAIQYPMYQQQVIVQRPAYVQQQILYPSFF